MFRKQLSFKLSPAIYFCLIFVEFCPPFDRSPGPGNIWVHSRDLEYKKQHFEQFSGYKNIFCTFCTRGLSDETTEAEFMNTYNFVEVSGSFLLFTAYCRSADSLKIISRNYISFWKSSSQHVKTVAVHDMYKG